MAAKKKAKARTPLTRERVLKVALGMVDRGGLDALSMRKLASKLGVEAMSLYHHVANKDDLHDGLVELVLAEIELPPPGTPWREAMRQRARSARQVFLKHPGAAVLVESCVTMTPTRLRYADGVIGLLMGDGFSVEHAYRVFLMLDSYIYGFTLQELSWPRPTKPDEIPIAPTFSPTDYPHFSAVIENVMAKVGATGLLPSYDTEFEFGLELLLDAIEQLRARATGSVRRT